MSVVNLELFKKHVHADDFADDDEILTHYLGASEATVIRYCNRSEEELTEMNAGTFPPELVQAMMMLAAHWYNQRESVSLGQSYQVPHSLQTLIKPFVKLTAR